MHTLGQPTTFLSRAVRGLRDTRKDVSDCLRALANEGRFLVTHTGDAFFFDNNSKVLMSISDDNDCFLRQMGSVGVTPDKLFIDKARSYALANGSLTDIWRMAHVDTNSKTVYVHSQGSRVYKVTAAGIATIGNGDDGIYFLAEKSSTPFKLVDPLPTTDDLFHDLLVKQLRFATGTLDEEQSSFLLIVWFCSLFLAGLLPVSPLLLLVGPASSGKTTFMRCISELLFGRDLSVVRMPGNDKMFDAVIGKRTFICLDGVTEWRDWFDERLEGVARKESIFVRRGQEYVEKRLDCSMAITTRQFPDEGLRCVNRLLPIMLERPERNVPERTIIDGIRSNRDVIMTQLLVRLQWLLIDLGSPSSPGYGGSYMSADFADIAFRVARSIGFDARVTDAFERLSSLHEAVLSSDQQAMELLNLWVAMPGNEGREVKSADLHKELAVIAVERGKTIPFGERPFAHWLSRSMDRLRQLFSIQKIEGRSNQRFYAIRRIIGSNKDMERSP